MNKMNNEIKIFLTNLKSSFLVFVVFGFIFMILFAVFQLNLVDRYYSSAKVAPIKNDPNTSSSALNNLSSITSSFGINIPSSNGLPDNLYALEVMKTRAFFDYLVKKYDLLPYILASKTYDKETKKVIFDDEIYISQSNTWNKSYLGKRKSPSKELAHKKFLKEMFESSVEKDTFIVTLSVSHHSPYFAQKFLNILISESDDLIRSEDLSLNENLILFLEEKIKDTNDLDQKNVFYSIISTKYQEQALIKSRKNYVFRILDPANLSEFKYYPSRLVNIFVAGILYTLIYVFILFILTYLDFVIVKEKILSIKNRNSYYE